MKGRSCKWLSLPIIFAGFILLAYGCDRKLEPSVEKTKVTVNDVKREAREALHVTQTYMEQEKEEYQKLIEAKLEGVEKEIAKLKDDADKKGGNARVAFDKWKDELQAKEEVARKRIAELKSSSVEAWNDTKNKVAEAIEDLRHSFQRAREELA